MSETTSTRNTKGMQTEILCTLNTLMFRTRKRAIVMTKGIVQQFSNVFVPFFLMTRKSLLYWFKVGFGRKCG